MDSATCADDWWRCQAVVNPIVYKRLVEAAQARSTVTAADLAETAGLSVASDDRKMLELILDNIAVREAGEGRPLLPIVVVDAAGGSLGAGLARYARRTGLATDPASQAAELNRVFAHWGRP
jgi:hypothetical protein